MKKRQSEWKGVLKAMQNMGIGLHKVFKTVVKDVLQYLPPLGKSGSEVSYFIIEPRNFAEFTKLSDDINKPWLKATQKEIKNTIKNQNFIFQHPEKDDPMTPFMDVYKDKIQSDGIIYKLKLRIVVRGYLQNNELFGDTWSPTASIRTLEYVSEDAAKHKARVHKLYFIGEFLQAKVTNREFVKLDSRNAEYFPEY